MNETIAAISTPLGEGAIALLRLSGSRAREIADAIFRGKRAVSEMAPRVQQRGAIWRGGEKVDEVLISVHRAPASYTGEDVVEICCHGGVLVTRRILELLLSSGARAAEPGEFTQRAFLHGKMDLTQAEAVMDLISAQTDLALQAASAQLEGRLGGRLQALRENVLTVLAHIEAYIDFPDEDIDPETGETLITRIDQVLAEIEALLSTAERGKILREGVRAVIFGAPNVGKSSLLNLLLGRERAIVSARPGTTRDVIEETINLHGFPVRLVDTAGLRESTDEIEIEGMARTQRQVESADLVIQVCDASEPRPEHFREEEQLPDFKKRRILVLNKSDLPEHESWRDIGDAVRISCVKNSGLDGLTEQILAHLGGGETVRRDWSVAINARHDECLSRARRDALAAREALRTQLSPEFVAEELRAALQAIGEVVGRVENEEVLGKIFSSFCIGK